METIILKAKILALRDLEIKLKEAQLENMIIPEIVFEKIKNLEDNYYKESQDDEEECLKCGEMCGKKLVGDESVYYCPNCN